MNSDLRSGNTDWTWTQRT